MKRIGWLVLTALVACSPSTEISEDTLATVAGETISRAEFDAYLTRNTGGSQNLEDVVFAELFQQFLDDRLLGHLAVERGMVEEAAGHTEALAFLLQGIEQTVDAAAVAAYYQANQEAFARREQVQLRQLLVHTNAVAREAADALAGGEEFLAVATRLSEAPIDPVGGDQGFIDVASLPTTFASVVSALEPGEYSRIVEAEYGYHIFHVVDRRPAATPPLDVVEAQIRDVLVREAIDDKVLDLLAEARQRYRVEVYPNHLPFAYRGSYADTD
ncbi:MAG: peptidyl-prolyl cis-trans isomerase [Acidobacteriota bacterium]